MFYFGYKYAGNMTCIKPLLLEILINEKTLNEMC
jgi:hypothetical protein